MDGERSVSALVGLFRKLPWDAKVFTVTDRHHEPWVVDVQKDGPSLTLTPVDSERDGRIEVQGNGFWGHLVTAFEEAHPGIHLRHDESVLARLFDGHAAAPVRAPEKGRGPDVAAARAAARRREEQWREKRAADHLDQYAIWYQ